MFNPDFMSDKWTETQWAVLSTSRKSHFPDRGVFRTISFSSTSHPDICPVALPMVFMVAS
jgi:hypothetical protein